jgi:hypothetical protein
LYIMCASTQILHPTTCWRFFAHQCYYFFLLDSYAMQIFFFLSFSETKIFKDHIFF